MRGSNRVLSILLALCLCISLLSIIEMPVQATYENDHTNTGNQAYDIVAVAQTQLGYQEGSNNSNKYSAAFNHYNVEWCAYFVSWCAKEAGISDSIIHRQGIASPFSGYFNIPNTHGSNGYFPKPGDLVFYGPDSEGDHYHVGIVETANASTGYITTIEGNTNSGGSSTGNCVYRHTRHYQHSTICCYGRPNYTSTSVKHTVNTSYGKNFTAYPKEKIAAVNIFDEYHNQIDSTSWIGTSDKCTIHEVYTDGCCKVTYPLDAGGTKTVYSKISLFNTHTHSYTGSRYYESAHPHAITQRCVDYDTCGGWTYTGEYYEKNTCEQCWHADFNISTSNVSVKVGESKTVTLSISGCWPSTATPDVSFSPDNGVVEVNGSGQQVTFMGIKEGTTLFQIRIYSDSTKSHLIGITSIRVDVSQPSYTISYNANGGTGAPGKQTKHHGTPLVLSSVKPSREGYTFLGWSESYSTNSAEYQPGGTFNSDYSTTLYAVWKMGCENGKHNYNYKETKAPTTSATGTLHGYCTKCSATTTVTLPKLNTTDYTYTVMDKPTCTGTGTGCYTLKNTTYGNQMFTVSIPATGHSYSYKSTKAPTTSATGMLTGTCSKCSGTTTIALPKLSTTDYTYKVTKEASCAATGTGRYTWKTTTYGSFYFDVTINRTVHSYSYKATQTPTTSATGTLTGTCSKCSGTTTVTLPKLNTTDYSYAVKTAATCTMAGSGRYTWKTTTYGSFYFDASISATGHNYSNGNCTRCGAADPNHVIDQNAQQIVIGSTTAMAGNTFTVVVSLRNNAGFNALNFSVVYNQNILTLVDSQNLVADLTMTKVTSYVFDGSADYCGNGELLQLTFKISENAPAGEYELQLKFLGASNEDFEEVEMVAVDGIITVSDVVFGDTNGDGNVTMVDLSMLRKYFASIDPNTGLSSINIKAGADANGDGSVSMVDLSMLRKYFASIDPETGESSLVLGPKK